LETQRAVTKEKSRARLVRVQQPKNSSMGAPHLIKFSNSKARIKDKGKIMKSTFIGSKKKGLGGK